MTAPESANAYSALDEGQSDIVSLCRAPLYDLPMRLIIDSNRLQSEELRAFLAASSEHKAVLTDYAWMEAYKGNSLLSISRSMQVLRQYPAQVIVLQGTKAIGALDARAPGLANRMIWPRAVGDFYDTVRGLDQADAGNIGVIVQMLRHGRAADEQMNKILQDAADVIPALTDMRAIFSPAELRRLTTRESYTHEMFDKIFAATRQMAMQFIRSHPQNPRPPSRSSMVNTFLFRMSLSLILCFLGWIRTGSQQQKRPERVRNDIVDANFAAYGTYFNGLLTADAALADQHAELRFVIRMLGGRCPVDYEP